MQTIRSILAATDLGTGSDAVVRAAAALAAAAGAQLHLVNALEIDALPALPNATFPARVEQAEAELAGQARRAGAAEPSSARVFNFVAHRAIEARAAEVEADLVVIGPHRGGEAGAHFLGTTAERVIRTAAVPVLVVHGELRLPARRVGVPSDLSGPARAALQAAADLAAVLGTEELTLFQAAWSVTRQDDPQVEERTLLPGLREQAREAGVVHPPPRIAVAWGVSPTDTIVDYAAEQALDLLVMGTHGRGGLRRFLVGSVASGVARAAGCPVLLVPPGFAADD